MGGLLAGTLSSRSASGEGWQYLPLAAMVAALLTGAALWRWVVQRLAAPKLWHGVLAGALTGLLAHYVCWYLLILSLNVCTLFSDRCHSSLGDRPLDPLNGLWGAAVYAALSLVLAGWFTLPIGALLGWVYARRQGLGKARASSAV